jgi:3-dehydroquinate synthetase
VWLFPAAGAQTLATTQGLYDVLLDRRFGRRARWWRRGGVLGDTVGRRPPLTCGVPFVQCPTTLLAMVDSSVGGKVGVQVPQART